MTLEDESWNVAASRWRGRWKPGMGFSAAVLSGFVLVISFLLFHDFVALRLVTMASWARQESNASAVQAIAAAIQVVFALVLIGVTIYTAIRTHDMAASTRLMAEVARNERRDAVTPVAILHLRHFETEDKVPTVQGFRVTVSNGGLGPAIDLRIELTDEKLAYTRFIPPVFPMALPIGECVEAKFELDQRDPFLDETTTFRWPHTEEAAAIAREVADRIGLDRHLRIRQTGPERLMPDTQEAVQQAIKEYENELLRRLEVVSFVARLTVTYHDVFGRPFRAEALLECFSTKRDPTYSWRGRGVDEGWRKLRFGPTTVTMPSDQEGTEPKVTRLQPESDEFSGGGGRGASFISVGGTSD
ncbi:MAG: hypothetical protein M3R02_30815 [Chloroflexota bacterium]|nr:hypothetical protein [Chloroflexota bacterium]